jgi:4-amino-4-deoxy-L-arabinose transferase-like glycosyltransferase
LQIQVSTIESANIKNISRGQFAMMVCSLVLLSICLFAIRLAAPPNLLDQDQERPASYVLDAVKNGNWICQRDYLGDITSKPPLYTWIVAGLTLVFGRINLFALYLPGAVAAMGTALLVLFAGRKYFGVRAGFFAALAVLLCVAGLKEFGLARTDGLFSIFVTAAALLAFRAWNRGDGWTWFWLASAAATLTKGPLGLILAAGGLLVCFWERKSAERLPLRGSQFLGIALFFLICGSWFFLAWLQFGHALIDKMLGKELVDHAITNRHGNLPGTLFYQPPLYYLGRAAPWSFFAYFGFWRIWKNPSPITSERRFERFLFCWFFAGLLIFCIAPQQRADHLWPIMPAAALIAGRELSRLTQKFRSAQIYFCATALTLLITGAFAFYYFGPRAKEPLIRQTVALKKLAAEAERKFGREFPLAHVDDHMTLQIYLNTVRPAISYESAAGLLRGREAALVAVDDLKKLEAARQTNDPPFFVLLPEPGTLKNCPTVIVGNRPAISF